MQSLRTIIKRDTVARESQHGSAALPAERLVRIPASRVDARRLVADGDAVEEAVSLRGVYRGGEVPASVMPYVMAELDLDPAFPLPEAAGSIHKTPGSPASGPTAAPALEGDHALEAAWQGRLDEAVERARVEAYEEGYVAAEAVLQASFDQRKEALDKDVARLQAVWKDFLKKSEPMMASLAFEVARQLLDAPLPQDVRAVSTQALSQALETFGEGTPIEITLHPDDYARLQAYGLTGDLEALQSSIRWNADASIPMGDWIVQSPESAIRRLKEEMLGHLKSRLGLLAVMKSRDS